LCCELKDKSGEWRGKVIFAEIIAITMSKKKTICIDFDGVLADYSKGYQGKDVFGEMLPNADIGTGVLKKNGWTIIIYTTRPATDALKKWLKDNNISYDYINENPDQPEESKGCKLIADIYLDDRGMQFRRWEEWTVREIAEFEPVTESIPDKKKDMELAYKEGDIWKRGKEKRIKAQEKALKGGKCLCCDESVG